MIKSIPQLNDEKACLFTKQGELIWRSPAWGNRQGDDAPLLGERWHEYIAPDDHDYVMEWFADKGASGPCVFRCLFPGSGQWYCCVWSKRRWRGLWLVMGDMLEVAGVPPPARIVIDHVEACGCERGCECGSGD